MIFFKMSIYDVSYLSDPDDPPSPYTPLTDKLNVPLLSSHFCRHYFLIIMASEITHGATGPSTTAKDAILETGAAVTQSFQPIKAICAHLNAFHVYASNPSRSVEANHYCTHLSSDVRLPASRSCVSTQLE
jgi:Protein of unknown function (DUF1264)